MDENKNRRDALIEALKKVREEKLDKAQKARISTPDRSVNLAQGSLDKDVLRASGGSIGADLTEPVTKIKGTKKILTKEPIDMTSGVDFEKKMKDLDLKQKLKSSFAQAAKSGDEEMMSKLRKIASKFGKAGSSGLKAIPVIGAAAGLAMNPDDASAAIPILDSAESVGESPQTENQMLAETQSRMDYEESQASKDRKAALAKLLNKGQ